MYRISETKSNKVKGWFSFSKPESFSLSFFFLATYGTRNFYRFLPLPAKIIVLEVKRFFSLFGRRLCALIIIFVWLIQWVDIQLGLNRTKLPQVLALPPKLHYFNCHNFQMLKSGSNSYFLINILKVHQVFFIRITFHNNFSAPWFLLHWTN